MLTPSPELRHTPRRVLIAEDDDDMRELLTTLLIGEGYEVISAASGAALLELVGDALIYGSTPLPIDLLITDLRMPGIDGLQALAGLRYVDWCTPVILITAFGGAEVRKEATRLGAAAVLEKPFDVNRLRKLVRTTMAAPR